MCYFMFCIKVILFRNYIYRQQTTQEDIEFAEWHKLITTLFQTSKSSCLTLRFLPKCRNANGMKGQNNRQRKHISLYIPCQKFHCTICITKVTEIVSNSLKTSSRHRKRKHMKHTLEANRFCFFYLFLQEKAKRLSENTSRRIIIVAVAAWYIMIDC